MKTILLPLIAALLFAGCAGTGLYSKVELRRLPVAAPVVVERNFVALAEYWDEHGERFWLDLENASHLTISKADGVAEISFGKPAGPTWGLVELRRLDDGRTEIRAFAVKGCEEKMRRWRDQLIAFKG